MKKKQRLSSARKAEHAGILIAGYFGFGNLGDELILESCVSNLAGTGLPLRVLWGGLRLPADLKADPVSRWDLFRIISLLAVPGMDVVIPGGEIFQSRTSRRSLWYYLLFCRLALGLGRRIFLLFQGLPDEFKNADDKKAVAALFKRAALASFRDKVPALLKSSGFIGPAIPLPDPVFGLVPKKGRPDKQRFVFVLKKCAFRQQLGVLVRSVLATIPDSRIVLAVFHPDDLAMNKWILGRTDASRVSIERPDAAGVMGLTGSAGFVFAMRYHAVVLAALNKTPFFAFTDEDKTVDLCRFLRTTDYFDPRKSRPVVNFGPKLAEAVAVAMKKRTSPRVPVSFGKAIRSHWSEVRRRLMMLKDPS